MFQTAASPRKRRLANALEGKTTADSRRQTCLRLSIILSPNKDYTIINKEKCADIARDWQKSDNFAAE